MSSLRSFEETKAKLLAMPLEEKRKLYRCGDRYVTVASIPSWLESCRLRQDETTSATEAAAVAASAAAAAAAAAADPDRRPPDNTLAGKVSYHVGDITALEVDAVVNAANNSLLGGGGVDGAIHAAAGPQLKAECATLHGCETGDAKLTGGYLLPARHVIHTVGPVGEKPGLLESCYRRSLQLAGEHQLRTVAFPCVSTGVYGYPNLPAARVALRTVRQHLEKHSYDFDRIIFCLFMEVDVNAYKQLLPVFFPIE